jgi:hypothetical protein
MFYGRMRWPVIERRAIRPDQRLPPLNSRYFGCYHATLISMGLLPAPQPNVLGQALKVPAVLSVGHVSTGHHSIVVEIMVTDLSKSSGFHFNYKLIRNGRWTDIKAPSNGGAL